jgi:arylsulfatase A-like enzyme
VHLFDAHHPYDAPEPWGSLYRDEPALQSWLDARRIAPRARRPLVGSVEDARASANAYDGELRYQDEQLGRLLSRLRADDLRENTLVVVAGDHGEGLNQHGEPAHGGTWYEQLHAPLLMRVPGQPARRISAPLSAPDVVPTLLGLLEGPLFSDLRRSATGRDILAPGRAEEPVLSLDTPRPSAHAARTGDARRHALTSRRWKYFRVHESDGGVRELLFDRAADPHELDEVGASHPKQVAELRAQLERQLAERRARGLALRGGHEPRTEPADPHLREQLCALGYLACDDAAQDQE